MTDVQKNKSVTIILDFLLYLFCGLPFLKIFIPFPMDIQPYAFCIAIVYLIVQKKLLLSKNDITIMLICFFAMTLALASIVIEQGNGKLLITRKIFNYFSFFIVSKAMLVSLKRTEGIVENWIKLIIIIWFLVGLIQTFFIRNFMFNFVSNMRTSDNRGVTSLASEPSFYGYMMIFFGIICSRFHDRKDRIKYQILCILQIIFFAKSAITILYILLFAGLYFVEYISKKKTARAIIFGILTIIAIIITGMITVRVFVKYFPDQRITALYQNIIKNISSVHSVDDIYKIDESVGIRVNAITETVTNFFKWVGLPHGFQGNMRYSSGYGVTIYELGIIGTVFIYIITKQLQKGISSIAITLGISIMMFSAIQIAQPMFAFIYGYAGYCLSIENKISGGSEVKKDAATD